MTANAAPALGDILFYDALRFGREAYIIYARRHGSSLLITLNLL